MDAFGVWNLEAPAKGTGGRPQRCRGRWLGTLAHDAERDVPCDGDVALGQVVRAPGTYPDPARQFSGSRPGAHAGR